MAKSTAGKWARSKAARRVGKEVKNAALAGIGALVTAREQSGKVYRQLVEKGEKVTPGVRKTLDGIFKPLEKLAERWPTTQAKSVKKLLPKIDGAWQRFLGAFPIPTKAQVATLQKRIEMLADKIDQLGKKGGK